MANGNTQEGSIDMSHISELLHIECAGGSSVLHQASGHEYAQGFHTSSSFGEASNATLPSQAGLAVTQQQP